MNRENTIMLGSLFGIFLLLFLLGYIMLAFVPDEVKNQKCIRTELRDSNIQCITEDNK